MRGNAGDLKGAQEDLSAANKAVMEGTAYISRLGEGDSDLDYLARGWTFSSVSLAQPSSCDGS